MAVYRPDLPVRLPQPTLAGLIAVAGAAYIFAGPPAQAAAYVRDATPTRLPPSFVIQTPPAVVLASAISRVDRNDYAAPRLAPTSVATFAQVPLFVYPGNELQPVAAYIREQRTPAYAAPGWFALFAPPDPAFIYRADFRLVSAYLREQRAPAYAAAPFIQAPLVSYVPAGVLPRLVDDRAYSRAPYLEAQPWPMLPGFATADPLFLANGPGVQAPAAYLREQRAPPLSAPNLQPPVVVYVPPSVLARPVDDRTYYVAPYAKALPRPVAPLFSVADPLFLIRGSGVQAVGGYYREPTLPRIAPTKAVQVPPVFVPRGILARIEVREPNRPTAPRLVPAGVFAPIPAVYIFRGVTPYVPAVYARERGAAYLFPIAIVTGGVPTIVPVFGNPTATRVAYASGTRIGGKPGEDAPRIGDVITTRPGRIGKA